ncbi:hypothetical protein BUALT_Bualt08G0103300 [Buddleja alternifolia]|uniref:SHSP domain-containing protein n=1 Tax=Buddleja alternifolia TaxID=168488 RepID=A0AAV6XBS3_9LAMI|nr:hypothetical protein BUALT_Bualt08G0103300 [Buddleja alternifolia]
MDLELGAKLTRIADEFLSDFRVAKDRDGPLFLSRETNNLFIVTAHLKGYKRANTKIDINKEGTLIAISGERQVIDTVIVGLKIVKRDKENKVFKKVFRIPDGVILDKISATFNEDDSTLTVSMPKKEKGIRGTSIEEVDDLLKEGSGNLQIIDEKIQKPGEKPDSGELFTEDAQKGNALKNGEKAEELENQKVVDHIEENTEAEELDQLENNDKILERTNKTDEEENEEEKQEGDFEAKGDGEAGEGERGRERDGERKGRRKRCKMCTPIVAGSAVVLVSFVAFVVHVIRSKNQSKRSKH